MTPTRASMSYATALNRNELFESPGLRRDIPAVLAPDEEVLLVLPGVGGDFPDVMIATDRRFLLASVAGPLKKAKVKREVPARGITGVEYRPGVFSRVRVRVADGRDVRMMPHREADAERFATEFAHVIRTGRLPS
ncbi:hypothetical protein ACFQS2_14725 [Brachybacterium sp. GCM10030267]|uniref:hypothetical protein n=1 Tax=Brachybacterium sp. GCM10030267 TaxID=3273381 RepID=UPI00360C307C